MAWIRASCPMCGDVELGIAEVQVMMCASTNEGSYVFRCPDCQLAVSKPAEPTVVNVLVASGVQMSVWQLPAELEEPHAGPPVGYDDLLAFHFELERDDWLERLLRGAAPGRGGLEASGTGDQP